ncbi:class I SAM-dependent methyltransferase [Actinoplanes derwentensis]|uniref:Methyltransferase domain-containing protein n=1 Tax=Actinoplanes derwentensis TaxID=113562 RepID=A0A1H1XN96_9ACTN|nr:class I SAM-dependent methyltransferase [Actinoplanes derwentensis]GID87710.1 methyltransferase [Actinoplanes derwentensis]SDT10747.1 Methyltransferase domain-containing protein [Actinoplanes derwentensis]
MNPDQVRLAYNTGAAAYVSAVPDPGVEAPIDRAMVDAFIAAVTAAGADPLVLDAGCGAGRMSRYLADRGCRVRGVDLSEGMVSYARRDHPDLDFAVGSLAALPYPDRRFAGVLLWYSAIHTPPAGQSRLFAEAARVLRPGGHLLIGFQAGEGVRDVSPVYLRLGYQVRLDRYCYSADQVAGFLASAGLREVSRLIRRPRDNERDDQAMVLARADDLTGR